MADETDEGLTPDGFAEECWFMRGFRIWGVHVWCERYVAQGTGCSVDFDWERAWDDRRLIGWRHTHPGVKFDTPSSVDDRTMRSWVKAAGKPLVCGVTCGSSTRYFLYARGGRLVYRFEMATKRLGSFYLGWVSVDGALGPVGTGDKG